MNKIILHVVVLVSGALLACSGATAMPILQGAGDHYVAWEAEIGDISDPDTDTRTWEVVNDATASGNQAIRAMQSGALATNEGLATYSIVFNEPGVYELFILMRGSGTCCNSVFIPPSGFFGLPLDGNRVSPVTDAGPYDWVNTFGNGDYTVTAGDLGMALDIAIGVREKDTYIDRFVLWNRRDGRVPFPSALSELSRLANSEVPVPATLSLLMLGLAAMGLSRRSNRATNQG